MRLELTKRGDYAVRAMLALTRGAGGGLLSARRIADAMDIPVRFLPQVLTDLQRAGLVAAAAGRTGGYRLARDPATVSLLEVIEAIEGDTRRQSCVLRGGPCGEGGFCDVHQVFVEGQDAIRGTFARASLAELAKQDTRAI
jgi:Rrf2 family iron-sulfur cluster assembly transcriptional regulator